MKRPLAAAGLLLCFVCCAITADATIRFSEIALWGGNCNSVAASGSLAYVGAGNCLITYDLSNPALPVRLSYVSLPDVVRKVVLSEHCVYVLYDWNWRVDIVDIHDPAKPALVGSYIGEDEFINGIIFDIAVSGTLLYVAGYGGVCRVDISNLAQPALIDGVWDGSCCDERSVAVYGDYIVAAQSGYSGSFQVLDLSSTWYPTLVGSLPDIKANSLTVSGHYIYAACGSSGVKIIDLADPAHPVLVGVVDTPGSASRVAVSGSLAYVADGTGGVQVLDIGDPAHPAIIGSHPALCSILDVALLGDHAIAADSQRGFRIVDVSTPSSPTTVYTCDAGRMADFAVLDSTVLASSGPEWSPLPAGLYSVDVSNPAAPAALNWTPVQGAGYLTVQDERAYLLGYSSQRGMSIFDVSNPVDPVLLSHSVADHFGRGVAFSGRYAYVGGNRKISVYDMADPANPSPAGAAVSGGSVYCLAVYGDCLYAGSYDGGLEVFSITNPLQPVLVSSNKQCRPGMIVPANGILYSASSPLMIFDISEPANPVLISTIPVDTGNALLSSSILYISNANGVAALDVTDPAAPVLVGQWLDVGGGAIKGVIGNIAYVLSGGTMRVLKMEQADTSLIYGRVLDAQGRALQDGRVSAGGISAVTDSQGFYVLGDLPAGEYTVTASGRGWTDQNKTCVLTGGQSAQVDFMFPLGTICGTVTDILGNPIAEASVKRFGSHPEPDAEAQAGADGTVLTGPDGSYCISEVYPGQWCVSASRAGYEYVVSGVSVIAGQVAVCDLVMIRRGAISGRVTDSRGAPLSGVTISFIEGYANRSATTDSGGCYTTSDVRAGTYEVNVWQSSQNVAMKTVSVSLAQTTTCDFTLPDRIPLTQIGLCTLGGEPRGICLAGNCAYVACGAVGLKVVDVSDPEKPTAIGVYDTPGSALDVAVVGRYAYVADNQAGLQILDVLDPARPVLVGSCNVSGNVDGVAVHGDYAYISKINTSLLVVSVRDPATPMVVGQVDIPARTIMMHDGHIYVSGQTNTWGELNILDCTDSAQPQRRGKYYASTALDAAAAGDLAFVTNAFGGFDILDVSDRSRPTRLSRLDTYFANAVCAADGRVFIADASGGLKVYDIRKPAAPLLIGVASPYANGVAVSGDYVYTTDVGGRLWIHDLFRPTVGNITPATAHNDGAANITSIAGKGFRPGCCVKLTRPGQPDIIASDVAVQPSMVACAFDLAGAMPGYWTVCVANPDGNPGKSSSTGFLIKVSDSAPRAGLRICDVSNPVTAAGARDYRFVVWGRVKSRSSTNIQIEDGSGKRINISGSGFTGISVGDLISACGTLEPQMSPPRLFCQPADIVRYK